MCILFATAILQRREPHVDVFSYQSIYLSIYLLIYLLISLCYKRIDLKLTSKFTDERCYQ